MKWYQMNEMNEINRMNEMNESALVGSIQRFSTEDGPGIRTTVFLKGCPLSCAWCHNPELVSPAQQLMVSPARCINCGACVSACPNSLIRLEEGFPRIDREACGLCLRCARECYAKAIRPVAREMTVKEAVSVVVQDKRFYDNTGGGLTVSGGDVLLHTAFVRNLITDCAAQGVKSCIDTSGYGSFDDLLSLTNAEGAEAVLYDIKLIDDDMHRHYTGVGNDLILNNLTRLVAEKPAHVKILARLPLIKDVNDSPTMAERAAKLLASLGIRAATLLPYHTLGVSKAKNAGEMAYTRTFAPPEPEKITALLEIYRGQGIETDVLGAENSRN